MLKIISGILIAVGYIFSFIFQGLYIIGFMLLCLAGLFYVFFAPVGVLGFLAGGYIIQESNEIENNVAQKIIQCFGFLVIIGTFIFSIICFYVGLIME